LKAGLTLMHYYRVIVSYEFEIALSYLYLVRHAPGHLNLAPLLMGGKMIVENYLSDTLMASLLL
jgi:hypothetical protein